MQPLFVAQPPKPIAEMTEKQRRAYARRIVDAVRERDGHDAEPK